jgi:hypothetical protein
MVKMHKQIAKIIAYIFAIMIYVSLFYGTYLLSIYLLRQSLGIYDIENRIEKIEMRLEE